MTPLGALPEEIRALENAVMLPSQEAVVEQLEDGRIRLEKLTVDPKAGSLTIPCKVNMSKGIVEYALVTEYGKCHESILKTESADDLGGTMEWESIWVAGPFDSARTLEMPDIDAFAVPSNRVYYRVLVETP